MMLVEPADSVSIDDYDWNQYEQTEQLMYVEDDEVSVQPNTSDEQMSHNVDANLKTNEHDEQLTSSMDTFRQQALMEMMDGVLEKRWEDELKKDVPKPECMVKFF